jgi:ABC-type phosphate/phosphonate transport system substrate-binding protein
MTWSAHLPIYDLPELRDRNDQLWQAVAEVFRDAGIGNVPAGLGGSHAPVLFTQVCGFPLQTTQRGQYAVIGTPTYAVDGCTDATHRAFIIVRTDAAYRRPTDLLGARFAVNEVTSNTGMNLARRYFARLAAGAPFFERVTLSGSHAASVELVADGRLDAAAIDCVTYAFLSEFRPELVARTRVLARTDPSPAIPFVTVDDADHGRISALRGALGRLSRESRYAPALRALHITGIRLLGDAAYAVLESYEREAVAAGYPVLC